MQQAAIGYPPACPTPGAPYVSDERMAQPPYSNDNRIDRDAAVANAGRRSAFRTKVCRYYQTGYCRSGSACPFKHSLDSDQSDSEVDAKNSSAGITSKSPPKMPPSSRVRPSISIPLAQYPIYPAYLCSPAWPSQATTSVPVDSSRVPFNPGSVPANMVPAAFIGHPFDPSLAFHLSPTESQNSELGTPLEDHPFSEPYIRRQSLPTTAPNSASGFFVPIPSPGTLTAQYVDRFGVPSMKTGGRSHHNRHSSAPNSRKLAASYKTKQCKFWRQDGSCPNGSKCTFIHDEDMAHAAAYQSSDDDSAEVASVSSQPPYDLPAKPLSAIEEQKKRGFYPISWRVIGGGVMMSGKREVCHSYLNGQCEKEDDCPFSHEPGSDDSVSQLSDNDPDEALNGTLCPPVPPGNLTHPEERSKCSAEGRSKASKPMSIAIPPAKDFFRATNSALPTAVPSAFRNNQDNNQATGGSSSHRRTRSMTISQTPGSPRSGTVNLFSAESPGGL